jgi:hypothetical protein
MAHTLRPNPPPPNDRRIHTRRMGPSLHTLPQVSKAPPVASQHAHPHTANTPSNLKPGGWIEQIEVDPVILCTDSSLPPNSSTIQYSAAVIQAATNYNHPMTTANTMRSAMARAGFIEIHEKTYKWPIGPWARDATLKEAGRLHHHQWRHGMEGWAMYHLTRWGVPSPWTKDEVHVLVAKVRAELNDPRLHMWQRARRVWGRRATDEEIEVNGGRAEIVVIKDEPSP